MKKVTYLAIFEPSNTGFGVYFPDFPGCISLGDCIEETYVNAKEALELHYYNMIKDHVKIPVPSQTLPSDMNKGCLIVPITIFPDMVKYEMSQKRVKTTITLPAWLKEQAEANNVNYSRLLEVALIEYLNLNK